MPAKTKKPSKAAGRSAVKPAVKKASAKKAPKKRASAAQIVEAVVVDETPDLMPPEIEKQVLLVEKQVGMVDAMSDQKIAEAIGDYSSQAAKQSGIALKAGASALVYAWACGALLNAAKDRLVHGTFGQWRKEHLDGKSISERTAMRYMKLAARCNDIRALLQWAPTLKQAYVECGILPGPSDDKDDDGQKGDPDADLARKKGILLSGVSGLQQKIQQCVAIKDRLDADELCQLRLAKHAIDGLFTQILG